MCVQRCRFSAENGNGVGDVARAASRCYMLGASWLCRAACLGGRLCWISCLRSPPPCLARDTSVYPQVNIRVLCVMPCARCFVCVLIRGFPLLSSVSSVLLVAAGVVLVCRVPRLFALVTLLFLKRKTRTQVFHQRLVDEFDTPVLLTTPTVPYQ